MSSTSEAGKLWMGPGTFEVSLDLFALNRQRLVERIRPKAPPKSVILLQGGEEEPLYDTDVTYNEFRQEGYFRWAFGVYEPGFYGIIEVDTGFAHIFAPRFPESYAVWMGPLHSLQYFSQKYRVRFVHYDDEIAAVLQSFNPSTLLILQGTNSDSGLPFREPTFDGIDRFNINRTILYNDMADLRTIKTQYEIDVMRYVINVSSAAHRRVMRFVKPGKSEFQCESEFLHHCYSVGGCRHVSYTCICASHTNAAILHYGHAAAPNDRFIKSGDMCLFDMGSNYFGYAADITCSFPADGKFTADQKIVYEAVLAANLAVFNTARPGVAWPDMHLLASKTLLGELKKAGLVVGEVDEMIAAGLGYIFQPHGLGHLLGLDVHDVGGYLPDSPPRRTIPTGLEKLRTSRVLKAGMIVTIEPGCYFVDVLLDPAFEDPVKSKYLVKDVLQRFRTFGGVRIEDDVLITQNGVENLTKVPRTVQEIEDWMAGKDDGKYD